MRLCLSNPFMHCHIVITFKYNCNWGTLLVINKLSSRLSLQYNDTHLIGERDTVDSGPTEIFDKPRSLKTDKHLIPHYWAAGMIWNGFGLAAEQDPNGRNRWFKGWTTPWSSWHSHPVAQAVTHPHVQGLCYIDGVAGRRAELLNCQGHCQMTHKGGQACGSTALKGES